MPEPTVSKPVSRPAGTPTKKRGRGKVFKKLIISVLVIVIIGGGLYWWVSNSEAAIHNYPRNKWQAVFLTNGQVYFGHVVKMSKKSVVLQDIYYLQVVTRPLQRSQEGGEAATTQPPQQEQRLTLIKLGNEIHGPYDRMNINRDQVILIENLKDNSRVVEAINRYVSEQQQQQEQKSEQPQQ